MPCGGCRSSWRSCGCRAVAVNDGGGEHVDRCTGEGCEEDLTLTVGHRVHVFPLADVVAVEPRDSARGDPVGVVTVKRLAAEQGVLEVLREEPRGADDVLVRLLLD